MLTSSLSRHTPLQCCNNTHTTLLLYFPLFSFCAVPQNGFGSNQKACNWASNGLCAGWFACMFVSHCWKASQIRAMCQCCRELNVSPCFCKHNLPASRCVLAVRWEADSASSKAPLPVLGKRSPTPPSPAPVREAYGLWVLFGLYSDDLIFVSGSSEDIHLNYQDEWTGRVIMGNGQLLF